MSDFMIDIPPSGEFAKARVSPIGEPLGPSGVEVVARCDTPARARALREHIARAIDQFMGPLGHWTKTPPTEPGHYWWRPEEDDLADVVLIVAGVVPQARLP